MTDPFGGGPSAGQRALIAYKGLPRWARVGAPVGVGVLVLGGVGSATGAGEEDEPEREVALEAVETTTTAAPSIDDAVEVAADLAPSGVSDVELERLIEATCEGLADGGGDRQADDVYDDVAAAVGPSGNLDDTVEAAGAGAEVLCPDQVADAPGFLRAIVAAAPEQPATTIPPTTAAPTTTAPPPTTTAPPVTAPPETVPPATDPPPPEPEPEPPSAYYANCSEARAAGAAPVYRGDPGYGSHLDRDGDGVGCES